MRLHSERENHFEGFTQNGCYGNQPQPFEVVFYSIDANTSCSVTKQNFTFKQAYRASLCFVLYNEPKFWHLIIVFSAFNRLYLETLFYATLSGQIISCHVTGVKMLRFFWFIASRHYWSLISPSFRKST